MAPIGQAIRWPGWRHRRSCPGGTGWKTPTWRVVQTIRPRGRAAIENMDKIRKIPTLIIVNGRPLASIVSQPAAPVVIARRLPGKPGPPYQLMNVKPL